MFASIAICVETRVLLKKTCVAFLVGGGLGGTVLSLFFIFHFLFLLKHDVHCN